jgi:hypothetical protein
MHFLVNLFELSFLFLGQAIGELHYGFHLQQSSPVRQ